jgi:hypothetical protein
MICMIFPVTEMSAVLTSDYRSHLHPARMDSDDMCESIVISDWREGSGRSGVEGKGPGRRK